MSLGFPIATEPLLTANSPTVDFSTDNNMTRKLRSATPTNLSASAKTHVVPAKHGYAFKVKKGDIFRIVDLHGNQIVDFMAFVDRPGLEERVFMSYTRYSLQGRQPKPGDYLLTNTDAEALKITADTYGTHDMTIMTCSPEFYQRYGLHDHRSCAVNIAEAMAPYGIKSRLELPDPFNLFQDSPNYERGPGPYSKAGDYIEFEAQMDLVIGLSCCPADVVSTWSLTPATVTRMLANQHAIRMGGMATK